MFGDTYENAKFLFCRKEDEEVYDSNYNFGFKDKEKTKQNKTTFEKERDTKRFKEEFKKENEYEYFPFAGA